MTRLGLDVVFILVLSALLAGIYMGQYRQRMFDRRKIDPRPPHIDLDLVAMHECVMRRYREIDADKD